MVVHVYKNADEIAKAAATVFSSEIISKPDCVLGFATGSSPIPTYKELIKLYNDGVLDFSKLTSFNLDEYVGLAKTHDQSYYYFMHDNLFNHVNIREENVNILCGTCDDVNKECEDYEARIEKAGGIDLQILGIGNNGHIAFNEPEEQFSAKTRVVTLTESTIEANKRFFASANDVPRHAVSMGIASIMGAKKIILIATGKAKAEAVKALVKGPVTPHCPASILQLHPNAIIFVDEDAASLLK